MERQESRVDRDMQDVQSAVHAVAAPAPHTVAVIHPIPPGYHCVQGALLFLERNSWIQKTARSNRVYCPPDSNSADGVTRLRLDLSGAAGRSGT
jgi:hypothetical protein